MGYTVYIGRGVARNSFWVGIILYCTILQSYILAGLTTSAAISAQNNFQGLILGGYIYRYTPRRYAPVHRVKWRHISMVAIRSPFCRSRPSYCA